MIDCKVPMQISRCIGTGTVTVASPDVLCITQWLPRWRTAVNQWAASRAHSACPENTLSLGNRDLEAGDVHLALQSLLDLFRARRLEEQLDRFAQVVCGLFDSVSLACHIDFGAERCIAETFFSIASWLRYCWMRSWLMRLSRYETLRITSSSVKYPAASASGSDSARRLRNCASAR